MSKSLLQRLYDGEIFPDEHILPKDRNYREIQQKISDERTDLLELLSPDEQQRLKSLNDLYYESLSMHSYASFEYGYRLGALLMAETLTGIDELTGD